jgi:aldose 1-epimerase
VVLGAQESCVNLTIANDLFGLSVDPHSGGRISSLTIAGRERLVVDRSRGAIGWGLYVMAPWAGRMRLGELTFDDTTHRLPCDLPPHAIHGTVYTAKWEVEDVAKSSIVVRCDLGSAWPFAGSITHHISLVDESVRLVLELDAKEAMPAQVGWHPWFAGPAIVTHEFRKMYVRGADGIPTGELINPTPPPHDDCFVEPHVAPRVTFDDGAIIEMHSDCDHWVVYDEQSHGCCVEPQSGPPNGVNSHPMVIAANGSLHKSFDLTCVRHPQIG